MTNKCIPSANTKKCFPNDFPYQVKTTKFFLILFNSEATDYFQISKITGTTL